MNPDIPSLLPLFLIPAVAAMIGALFMVGLFALIYFIFFRSIIRTWFEERARYDRPKLSEERVIQLIRQEIRDERIRRRED